MEYANDGIMARRGGFQFLNLPQIQHSNIPVFPALLFQEVLRCERVLLDVPKGRALLMRMLYGGE